MPADGGPGDAPVAIDTSIVDVPLAEDAPIDASVADTGSDAPIPPDAPVPTFVEIYEDILRPRCERCHGGDHPLQRSDAEAAYDALIDVPVVTPWAEHCGDGMHYRVRPRDLDASMLAWLADCYVRDATHDELTEDEAATIRAWIAGGAPEGAF